MKMYGVMEDLSENETHLISSHSPWTRKPKTRVRVRPIQLALDMVNTKLVEEMLASPTNTAVNT